MSITRVNFLWFFCYQNFTRFGLHPQGWGPFIPDSLNVKSTITVDNLEVGQFIYMLLTNKIRIPLTSIMEKGVLLLGRFRDGGNELLQAIAEKLREMNYLPMIFDFEVPDTRDYIETVKILAGLSRFAIVDLSGPSVPQELYATVPHFRIPFVPIIDTRRSIHFTFRDFLHYDWVLPVVRFTDKEQLLESLSTEVIEPAERKIRER